MTKAEKREQQILNCMKTLNLTREEAIEMLEDDEDINHGIAKDWDLSEEEHKKAMKNTNVGERKVQETEKKKRKPRKPNNEKREIINALFEVCAQWENATITNPEKYITFSIGDNDFTINLVRKNKNLHKDKE